jgi:methylated-DNA-protein-cysteine methyltransferase-like protein
MRSGGCGKDTLKSIVLGVTCRKFEEFHYLDQFSIPQIDVGIMHSPDYVLIYSTIRRIPRGKVASYGEITRLCGLIRQARLVGRALRNLPPNSGVPWHRVVNAQGKISFPVNSASYRRQKSLLVKDGVRFRCGQIDLSRFGWLRTL